MPCKDNFTPKKLAELFPEERTNFFFDALFGEAEEGAYTISLRFVTADEQTLSFAFDLTERPGKCLVCSLTYGLPQVFARHPVINAAGLATILAKTAGKQTASTPFSFGATQELAPKLHSIPFFVHCVNK